MGGVALITADHGNADQDVRGGWLPVHRAYDQPRSLLLWSAIPAKLRKGGRLADIAPTMLEILGLPQPAEMDGRSLIEE